jgi:hypothetical protein
LIAFDEPLQGFINYVRRVGKPPIDVEHVSDDEREWFDIDPRRADSARLRRQGYELTDQGRLATEAITRAVASQLARAN